MKNKPKAILVVGVVCTYRWQQYEVSGYYPTRLFWDVHCARLLVCEARRAQSENPLELNGTTDSEVVLIITLLSLSLLFCISIISFEISDLLLLFCYI